MRDGLRRSRPAAGRCRPHAFPVRRPCRGWSPCRSSPFAGQLPAGGPALEGYRRGAAGRALQSGLQWLDSGQRGAREVADGLVEAKVGVDLDCGEQDDASREAVIPPLRAGPGSGPRQPDQAPGWQGSDAGRTRAGHRPEDPPGNVEKTSISAQCPRPAPRRQPPRGKGSRTDRHRGRCPRRRGAPKAGTRPERPPPGPGGPQYRSVGEPDIEEVHRLAPGPHTDDRSGFQPRGESV